MEKLTMTVPEMADQLNISNPKAYDLAHSAGFPATFIGRRIVVPVDKFKQWVNEKAMEEKVGR